MTGLTPESLADLHSGRSVHHQGETYCTLCRTGAGSQQYYPWPCPVYVAAYPELLPLMRDGYGLAFADPPPPPLSDEDLESVNTLFEEWREKYAPREGDFVSVTFTGTLIGYADHFGERRVVSNFDTTCQCHPGLSSILVHVPPSAFISKAERP